MVIIIKNPGAPVAPSRVRRYPWEEWADGQWREAMQGVDYICKTSSFAIQAKSMLRNYHPEGYRNAVVEVVVLPGDPDRVQFRLVREDLAPTP